MTPSKEKPCTFNPDVDLMRLEERQDRKEYQEAFETLLALRKAGYNAMYGWSKGHGFWIQGLRTLKGNHKFFTIKQALKLISK